MRFQFDDRKSKRLRAIPNRGIGFEEAQEIFSHPYYLDQRSDLPEPVARTTASVVRGFSAARWPRVGQEKPRTAKPAVRATSLVFEVRKDREGEYYHLVTLWRATRQEQQLYEEHS